MERIQLYVAQQGVSGYAAYLELDLYAQEPIKLTKSVSDLYEPTATTSVFSRQFRVPNTNSNGDFFKAVFNVNATDFDATKKASAYINIDGAYFTSGYIKLDAIIRNDRDGKIDYEILFLGETANFGGIVSPKDLSILSLANYAHPVTYQNIRNSWTYNLFNGDIVYPLAEWGYTYDADGLPEMSTVAYYDPVLAGNGFTNSGHPLDVYQFKPAIRMKVIWDKIFEDAGFTYESNFLGDYGDMNGSQAFTNLYMVCTNSAEAETNNNVNFQALKTGPTGFQNISTDIPTPISFTFESYDIGNNYNPPTSTFTAPILGGPYNFTVENLNITYRTLPGTTPAQLELRLMRNGVVDQVKTCTVTRNTFIGNQNVEFNSTFIVPFTVNANPGDEFQIWIYISSGQFVSSYPFTINDGIWQLDSPALFDPAGLLPIQYKQIDFIKGVNDRFKLIWTPDPENPFNFFIEPWVDWIRNGRQLDWTEKLNENQDIKLTPLFYTQPRQIKYKDSEEGDDDNFSYQQAYKETFGQLNTDSNIELITGERIISSFFASTPVSPVYRTFNFLIPHFAKINGTQKDPILVKPRMLYYNGLIPNPVSTFAPFVTLDWYMYDDVNLSSEIQYEYPLFSSFTSYPFNTNSSDLNWTNSPQFFYAASTGFSGRTSRTAFSEYWETWWNSTYDKDSRVMEATFALDSTDVQNLQFNDVIFIKDSWWFPTLIKDYVLGAKQNVRVELIKLGTVGINIGATGANSGITTYRHPGLCFDPNTACGACCCTNLTNITVFTDNPNLNASTIFYSNEAATQFASPGYYSDGTNYYVIDPNGFLVSIGVCSGCDCGPTGGSTFFADVCYGITLCEVCCCTSPEISVYGNGPELDTSSKLWPTATGGTLLPGYWYGTTGGNAVRIGADGNSVETVGLCDSCICDQLEYDELVSGGTGSLSACCAFGATGTLGFNTVYTDNTVFASAGEFYFDPFFEEPVGPTSSTFISNGEYFHQVLGGTAIAVGPCVPSSCPGRTEPVNYYYENLSFVDATEISGTHYISENNVNFIIAGTDLVSGSGFDVLEITPYAPSSYMKSTFIIPPGYTGSCEVSLAYDSVEVYSTTFATPGQVTTDSFLVQPGATADWLITWQP
jgi:hypothetical protein